MKKILILVKHSLPEIVEQLPAREWYLSEAGRFRAEHLAARLAYYKPEILISSVEPKAMETAEIVASKLGLTMQVLDGLHEHERTTTPFLSRHEFQNAVQEFFLRPDELVFGGETANEAHSRFSRAVKSVLQNHETSTIVIVSHGTVISLFVSRLTGASELSLWQELGLPGIVALDMNSNTIVAQENIL